MEMGYDRMWYDCEWEGRFVFYGNKCLPKTSVLEGGLFLYLRMYTRESFKAQNLFAFLLSEQLYV